MALKTNFHAVQTINNIAPESGEPFAGVIVGGDTDPNPETEVLARACVLQQPIVRQGIRPPLIVGGTCATNDHRWASLAPLDVSGFKPGRVLATGIETHLVKEPPGITRVQTITWTEIIILEPFDDGSARRDG